MKVAIVNLSKLEDIAKSKSYKLDTEFLVKNNIDFIDYASGRSSEKALLAGFSAAVSDKDVSLVLFYQGGTTLIKFLDNINWADIKAKNICFCGISDFTHFSALAAQHNIKTYYGFALKNVTKYYSTDKQKELAELLKSLTESRGTSIPSFASCYQPKQPIIGGHLNIMIFMLSNFPIRLDKKVLFIEYHNGPGEDFSNIEYYIDQLKIVLTKNKPAKIILGHSLLFDENGEVIDFNKINSFIQKKLESLGVPISQVDHFEKVIPIAQAGEEK